MKPRVISLKKKDKSKGFVYYQITAVGVENDMFKNESYKNGKSTSNFTIDDIAWMFEVSTISLMELIVKKGQTPREIHPSAKKIGKFKKALETTDFIFFVDENEGDENGSVRMYRKDDYILASDNIFAYNALLEYALGDDKLFVSESLKYGIEEMKKLI